MPEQTPAEAEALAVAHEERMAREDRRARGAFYTPPALVAWVLDRALDGVDGPVARVVDPACGAGHFLVAAAQRLGVGAVHGSDTDAEAVRIARLRLRELDPTVSDAELEARVRVADGLTTWQGERFDAVVGNPPFLGQLRRRTSGQTGGLAAYTDTSAVFLHRALDLVDDGGVVALVQPLSVLAARDAGPVRRAVAERGAVTELWASAEPLFAGAAVRVCVPVVRVGATGGPGPDDWGLLAAPSFGIPAVELAGAGVVGDLALCTADFRDQYYGLVPHVSDGPADGGAPLVTSGLIEPAHCRWGEAATRFAKTSYDAPVVDLAGLRTGPLAAWADARLVPKLLVAGQGRVVEAVVDETGAWLPSVPVVTVAPYDAADLWRLLAVTLAPPVVAQAAARYLGTGLTPGSVKLSARQVAALPLPAVGAPWEEAAGVARAAQRGDDRTRRKLLERVGALMCAAYGVSGDDVLCWWSGRLG